MSLRYEVPKLAVARLFCLLLIILCHQYLAQAAQGFMVLAEPIGQTRQDSSSNPSNRPSLDASSLVGLATNGFNPLWMGQTFFPQTFPALQSDLSNNYKMLTNTAQNGFNGLQSGFGYLQGMNPMNSMSSMSSMNPMNHYNSLQQGFSANYLSGEEMLRRMYEMMSNPQQMCNQLAAQTQNAMKTASQLPQQAQQQMSSSLNQMAQSTDNTVGSIGSMLSNSKPASSLLKGLGNFGKK